MANIESSAVSHYAMLGMAIVLAATLRFYKLGAWSFWIDEIHSLQSAQAVVESGSVLQRVSTLLIGASIQRFGVSEWSMRLAPAVIGLITVPVVYLLVRKLFDRQVALIATLLLAISPWHLFWSQNARFYTALLLLYLGAMVSFYWSLEKQQTRFLILALVLLALALLERLFAAFLIPIVIGYVILVNALRPGGHSILRFRKLLPVVVVPVMLLALYDMLRLATGGESTSLTFLVKFIGNPNKSSLRFLASFVYRVGIPILCLGTAGGVYLIIRKKAIGLYLLISALLPPLLLTLAAPFIFTADRYALVTLPSWIILSAVAIKELFSGVGRHAGILALAIPLIVVSDAFAQNFLYYSYQNGGRHDWRSAYALIEQQGQEDDVVIASRPQIGAYYLGREVKRINDMDSQTALQSGQRTWFVVNEEVNHNQQRWIESHAQLIEVLDVHIPGKILSLRLYLYDPAQ